MNHNSKFKMDRSKVSETYLQNAYIEYLRKYYDELLANQDFHKQEILTAEEMVADLRGQCDRETRRFAA